MNHRAHVLRAEFQAGVETHCRRKTRRAVPPQCIVVHDMDLRRGGPRWHLRQQRGRSGHGGDGSWVAGRQVQRGSESGEVDGFDQDDGRAQGPRLLVDCGVRVFRDDGDPDRRVERADALEGLEAAQPWHVEVENHDPRAMLLHTQQRLQTVPGLEDSEPAEPEKVLEDLAGLGVVVDHEGRSRLTAREALAWPVRAENPVVAHRLFFRNFAWFQGIP